MFNVIDVETGEVVYTFDDGATAGRFVAERNQTFARGILSTRYRIVRQNAAVVSDEWMARESDRFADGTYRFVPWHDEPWNKHEHFCHVSSEDDGKLAYTATAENGERDIQTRTRPGRYLSQYYSDVLSQDEIREWCGKFDIENGKRKLLLATTPDEIEQVYTSGPHSCMAHSASYYSSPVHPARVYGSGDFACAYILGTEGNISARVIVAPERKVYSRIYGDYSRLRLLLEEAGYTCGQDGDDWDGLRLLRIEARHGFVAPYFDSPMSNVRDNGKFLIVDCDGSIECHETNGLANKGELCRYCDNRCSGDTYTVGGETWCESCYENYSAYCSGCGESYHCDDMVGSNRHGESFCYSCASDMSTCEHCGYLDEDTVETLENETWCDHCAEGHLEITVCAMYARNPTNCDCEICSQEELEV